MNTKQSALKMVLLMVLFVSWNIEGYAQSAGESPKLMPSDNYTTLPHDLITPHVAFAKPLQGGPVKALFLVPYLHGRDVVELWQRFDLEYNAYILQGQAGRATPYEAPSYILDRYSGLSKEELENDLLKKLDTNPQVIVLVNADLSKATPAAQEKVLKLVKSGVGLVLTYRAIKPSSPFFEKEDLSGRERISSGVPWTGLPELFSGEEICVSELPAKTITTYTCGKGRVVVIRFRSELIQGSSYRKHEDGLTPSLHGVGYSRQWDDRYGRYLSLISKAVFWASGRQQQWKLSMPGDGSRFERKNLPKEKGFNLQVVSLETGTGNLLVEIRDPLGEVAYTNKESVEIKEAGESVVLSQAIPKVKAGLYYMDVRLLVNGKTADWGSLAFRVTVPEEILTIKLYEETVERGEEVRGVIFLAGVPTGPGEIHVRAIDTNGRIYAETHQELLRGNITIPFGAIRLDDPSTIASYIEAEIVRDGEVITQGSTVVFVPKRNMQALDADEFPHLIWGTQMPGLATGMVEARQQRRAGFNTGLSWSDPDNIKFENMAMWDIAPSLHLYSFRLYPDGKGGVKPSWSAPFLHDSSFEITDGSMANPEVKDNAWEWIRFNLADSKKYGPFLYNIGNECFYRGEFGFSSWGMKAYERYLAARYGSIDRLNEEWGKNYKSFKDVPRLNRAQARAERNVPAMIDHRAAQEMVWREMFMLVAEKVRQYDPRAKMGGEGSETRDLEAMLSALDFWEGYSYGADRTDVLGRCVKRKTRGFAGAWYGAFSEFESSHAAGTRLWEQLFQGFAKMGWYFKSGPGQMGNLMADFSYTDFFKTQMRDFELIHNGIGQLLRTCSVKPSGVAIHWSQASRLGFEVPWEFGAYRETMKVVDGALISILKKQHIVNWDYITGHQLENKPELAMRERVIFLPISQCLSKGEVSTLKEFVKQGGLLVGDGLTGSRSVFGRELHEGQLDEVFGVQTKAPAEMQEVKDIKTTFTWKGKTLPLESNSNKVNKSITVTAAGARVLAEASGVPLVVANRYGKGNTVLLNLNLAMCEQEALSEMVMGFLESAGVSAPVRFLPEPGPGDRCGVLEKGDLTLLGVILDYHQGKWNGGKVILPEALHIYDVKAGKYLGKLKEIEVEGQKDIQSAALFAMQKEKIKDVKVIVPKVAERDKQVTIECEVSAEGTFSCNGRVVRVELRGPDGELRTHYRRMAYLKDGGRGKVIIEFALNDPTGGWEVIGTDIASGMAAHEKLLLR